MNASKMLGAKNMLTGGINRKFATLVLAEHFEGKINPSILLTDNIERDLEFILQSRPQAKLELHAHPFVSAFLKKGLPSKQMSWFIQYHFKWIKIKENTDFQMTQYTFFDGNDDEIRLH